MHTKDLPTNVETYFTLRDGSTPDQAISTFAADAHVTDDGRTYTGRDAILAWLTRSSTEYTYESTRLSAEPTPDGASVTTHLTGTFPGGQVDLRNTFVVDDDGLISRLTICA